MNTWQDFINEELKQAYLKSILNHVAERRQLGINIYPKDSHVFEAFNSCPFEQVKIVLIGQDPYHGANQAHGLSFSVLPGEKIPPSLKNIYKELQTDIDEFKIPDHGYLKSWAKQGVLLLNTVLTVEQGEAHSHAKLGWERFTEKAIEKISAERANVIFLLWGAHAQKKSTLIDQTKHVIFSAPHPSPLSVYRGFYGCKHFSKSNEQLVKWAHTPIDWQLPVIQTSLFA